MSINGKSEWKASNIEKEFIPAFKAQHPECVLKDPIDMNTIISNYYNESLGLIKQLYTDAVIQDKKAWLTNTKINQEKEKYAEDEFDSTKTNPTDSFWELPAIEQQRRKDAVIINYTDKIEKDAVDEATRIANVTIGKIDELEKNKKLKPGYNAAQILVNLATVPPRQEDYLVDEEKENWLAHYCGPSGVPKNAAGEVDMDADIVVYSFQCGDIGGNNFIKYDGNIGAKDGMLSIAEQDYNKLLNDPTVFKDGICTDIAELSARLGNVPLGTNPIAIRRKVKLGDLRTNTGDLSTAYFGEFSPPLKTQGGFNGDKYVEGLYEAVIPPTTFLVNGKDGPTINPDIQIISHSSNVTSEQIMQNAQGIIAGLDAVAKDAGYTVKDNDFSRFVGSYFSSIDNNLDKVQEFRNKLSQEERDFMAKLMKHLGSHMQSKTAPTSTVGARAK